jgi:thioredoxin-related protein
MVNMKILMPFLFAVLFSPPAKWLNNLDDAKKIAIERRQLILLNFSGSDWCGPCIRLRKEVFESAEFKEFSDSNIVTVNADFPRLKKNQLSKEQIKKNESLADIYNAKGIFPLTLLLNTDGKVLKKYEGFPDISAKEFVNEVKIVCNANK